MFGKLQSNKVYVPLITILGSVALFYAYSFFYVAWQRNYANERAFRLLSVVGGQLEKRFDNLKSVMAASLVNSPEGDSPTSRHRNPARYLRDVPGYHGQISNVVANGQCPPDWNREGDLTLRVLPAPGVFALRAEFKATLPDAGESENCSVTADVKPSLDLRERFHNLTGDYFDDILIATSTGDVLFESNATGLRITKLDALFSSQTLSTPIKEADTQGGGKSGTPSNAFEDASQFSSVRDVNMAGSSYKLYVQPVPLQIGDKQYLKTLICGLWRQDRQQSQVVSIPYANLIWGILVVLAIFGMVWPFLKVAYMSPAERLKRTHVLYLLSSGLFVTTILTVIVLNHAYTVRDGEESEEQLRKVAEQIDKNLTTELARALNLMVAMEKDEEHIGSLLRESSGDNWTKPKILENPFFQNLTQASNYPYFDNLFWADKQGNQLYKVTVHESATPQTSVKDYSYFQYARDGQHLTTLEQHLKALGQNRKSLPDGIDLEALNTPFRFESRYSPNTGEYFVILARQSALRNLPARFDLLKVQFLVGRFASLIGPVVPTGYGYAVVDHDGLVQFHSSEGRNQVEDFLKESREDPVLKAMVINGTSDYVNVDYNGRRQLMLVRPLEYLADPPLTLIVFRDTNYFTTIQAGSMLVFSLLAGLFSVPFLAGLAIYVYRPVAYPLERLWPSENHREMYVNILVADLCMTAAFVIHFPTMEAEDMVLAVLTIAAIAAFFVIGGSKWASAGRGMVGRVIVLAGIILIAGWSWGLLAAAAYVALSIPPASIRLEQFAQSRSRVNLLYVATVFSLLMVLVVLPCFGLFKISYHAVNRVALEAAERDRLDLLNHRANDIRDHFGALEKDPGDGGGPIGEALSRVIALRIGDDLDRYDKAIFWPSDVKADETPSRDVTTLEKGIAWAAGWFPSNNLGAELRETAMVDTHGKGLPWKHAQHDDDEVLMLTADFHGSVPEGTLKGVYPMWKLPLLTAGLMAILALVLFVWLGFMIRKIFLTDLAKVPHLDSWVPLDDEEHNLLIIGHPKSGKTTEASHLKEKDALDLARAITTGDWTLPELRHRTVVVDNFEFDIDNPDTCLAKLKLLEELIYLRNKRVIVLATVDPMFYVAASSPEILTPSTGTAQPPAQLLDRWAAVLSSFIKLEIDDHAKKNIDAYVTERISKGTPCPPELVELVKAECDHTAHLRRLGIAMLEEHCKDETVSRATLAEELLDRADAYYRVLWSTCTKEERLVLFQLARDGWANPKNGRAIQQLERRRIVCRSPGLRIMNDSFCKFVNAAQLPNEVAKWEEDERHSAWSALKLGLTTAALMAGAWLLYTQQNVFQMGIGYVAAMATAGGAVLSLIRNLSRAKSGSTGDTAG